MNQIYLTCTAWTEIIIIMSTALAGSNTLIYALHTYRPD